MEVAQGAIHALIGPNGAGKSTVFNCVSRFYRPVRGRHRCSTAARCWRCRRTIASARHRAHLPEHRALPPHDRAGKRAGRHDAARAALLSVRAGPRRSRTEAQAVRDAEADPARAHRAHRATATARPSELDFGRQKMLDLARALAAEPQLLLLDEPAAGLRNREIAALDSLLLDLARTSKASPSCWSST